MALFSSFRPVVVPLQTRVFHDPTSPPSQMVFKLSTGVGMFDSLRRFYFGYKSQYFKHLDGMCEQ